MDELLSAANPTPLRRALGRRRQHHRRLDPHHPGAAAAAAITYAIGHLAIG